VVDGPLASNRFAKCFQQTNVVHVPIVRIETCLPRSDRRLERVQRGATEAIRVRVFSSLVGIQLDDAESIESDLDAGALGEPV
jgi:hypothetical protein